MSLIRKASTAAVGLLAAAALASSALAGSSAPVPASIQADITKTSTDVKTLHDTIVADANKIQADVQSLTGSIDRSQIKSTLSADLQQLASDRKSANDTIKADWQQLQSDWQAAHAADETKGQIAPLVKEMVSSNLALRADLQQAVKSAREAIQGLRASLKSQGSGNAGGASDSKSTSTN